MKAGAKDDAEDHVGMSDPARLFRAGRQISNSLAHGIAWTGLPTGCEQSLIQGNWDGGRGRGASMANRGRDA